MNGGRMKGICWPAIATNAGHLSVYFARSLVSLTPKLLTRYDPKVFRDPITDLEQLNQPLEPDDERRFCYIKAMPSDQTPVFYQNALIRRLINVCMMKGEKEKMRKLVYDALEIVKRRQYKLWRNAAEKEKANIELDPVVIAEKAIKNSSPLMMLHPYYRGGQTYMIPCPLKTSSAEFRAMKMMRDICRQKAYHGATHFQNILADELIAASKNEGLTVQAKQDLHKQCEANRAYVHYRK